MGIVRLAGALAEVVRNEGVYVSTTLPPCIFVFANLIVNLIAPLQYLKLVARYNKVLGKNTLVVRVLVKGIGVFPVGAEPLSASLYQKFRGDTKVPYSNVPALFAELILPRKI